MKEFNENFRTKLYQIIEDIENNSLVEIVSIIRQKSDNYKDIGLLIASIIAGVALTVMMFIPFDINPYLIFIITIVLFLLSFYAIMLIPALLKLFLSPKRIKRNVEIMARAIFQKGGIRFTEERIGVLLYISYLEKKVYVIFDRGVELRVPQEDREKMILQFEDIFRDGNVADNFLKVLSSTKDIFNEYIPPVENDINELPDNLKVDL